MTGPIYIEGAEPGDKLEIRILKVTPRAPYGVNNVGNGGAAPGLLPDITREEGTHIIRYDIAKKVANFLPGISFPTRLFMGTMAVETPVETSSQPPGQYGGNMDFERLQAGSTLYLPVLVKGGMFVAGDSHAAQGDGEVSGNAIEASMAPTLQFIVHKGEGKDMEFPYAEDAKNFYILGMDLDLGKALASAIQQTIKFLGKQYGMSAPDAYSLCSTAIDFAVSEAVDTNLVMYGTVPKAYFKEKFPYWKKA
jgi:acetamidase/formamidase